MNLVKASMIAFVTSAALASPVLAQGISSDTQIRGGVQGKSGMQGGTSGSGDEEFNAQSGVSGERAGGNAKAGVKGTVGSAAGASSGAVGGAGGAGVGGKRH